MCHCDKVFGMEAIDLDLVRQVVALVSTGDYLGLAILVLGLVQTWLSHTSAFPVNVRQRWLPLVTGVVGQGYAVLLVVAAHQPIAVAVVHGVVASAVAVFTSHAIWGAANAPPWVKWVALVLRDLKPAPPNDAAKKT